MTREIVRTLKFRAWHEGYPNTMVSAKMLYEDWAGEALLWKHQRQPVHTMQFTGLLDKNGVEIYEGDILGVRSVGGEVFVEVGVVKFDDGDTMAYWVDIDEMGYTLCRTDKDDYEVIGNIYEHAELLEEWA